MMIRPDTTVLFQGDSITDASRRRDLPLHLGNGYPAMAAALYSSAWPQRNVTFLNRGCSGDRAANLLERLQADFLDIRPDVVSILIGINDCWRRYRDNDPTPADKFHSDYREIIMRLKEEIDPLIVLCEPFVLPVPEERRLWREDLDPKIDAVRALAREFDAQLVPLDGLFRGASTLRPPEFWAEDGIHPTQCGHMLIARAWLNTLGCFA